MFSLILTQTIQLSFRKGGGALGGLAFYGLVFTLFTFGLGPEIMQRFALPVLCVSLVLANMLSQALLYERDYEEGVLEQYLLSPTPLEWLVFAKLLGQWLTHLLPIILIMPLLGIMSNLSATQTVDICLRLLLLSPSLVAIGSLSASLTLGARRGSLLPALISLPLTVPLVIFACGLNGAGALFALAGFAFALLPLSCWLSAAMLRMSE